MYDGVKAMIEREKELAPPRKPETLKEPEKPNVDSAVDADLQMGGH